MTVKELAALAGVSPATVSLVLNNKKGVSEEKRQEILKLIEETGYTSSRKEETRNRNILFIKYSKADSIVEENVGFISRIMDAAEAECQKQKYHLVVMANDGRLQEALNRIKTEDFCGILILGTELDASDHEALKGISIPYVVVDNSMPHFDCNCVAIDNKENVFKAIESFAKQGFTELGYLKGTEKIQNFTEREQGVLEAAAHFSMKLPEENIFPVPSTMLGAFEMTQKYLAAGRTFPGCLFADNDIIAIGAMKALKMAGFRIPEDISVIGFDNIPFSKIYSPTISTMNVDTGLLGRISLSLLRNMEENKEYKNVKVTVGGDLIRRQSTR